MATMTTQEYSNPTNDQVKQLRQCYLSARVKLADAHDITAVQIGQCVYAMDWWTYRDDNNNVQAAYEWVRVDNMSKGHFAAWLGY